MEEGLDTVTLAGGCFWCVEAVFKELEGVVSCTSGYSGGHVENPSYEEVCTGETGHAEAVQVTYDPEQVGLEEVLEVFFRTHDPTTLNRQGPDVGEQYRSAVFYHTEEQKTVTEEFVEGLEEADVFDDPIVTEIAPMEEFYAAEDYHQDYYEKNPRQQYCRYVVRPKLEKFRKKFKPKVRQTQQV